MPMGGWAEDGQAAPRHHDPLPEESSEDDMPPHIHKVNAVRCVVGMAKLLCARVLKINLHFCPPILTLGYITKPAV